MLNLNEKFYEDLAEIMKTEANCIMCRSAGVAIINVFDLPLFNCWSDREWHRG